MGAHLVPGEDPPDHPGPAGEEGGVLAAGVHAGQVRVGQPVLWGWLITTALLGQTFHLFRDSSHRTHYFSWRYL